LLWITPTLAAQCRGLAYLPRDMDAPSTVDSYIFWRSPTEATSCIHTNFLLFQNQ